MRSEATFAALCGVCPIEASSSNIVRHRVNRGGDRHANNALWRIATVRLSYDQRSRDYAARRRAEGKTRRGIIRCLERHNATGPAADSCTTTIIADRTVRSDGIHQPQPSGTTSQACTARPF